MQVGCRAQTLPAQPPASPVAFPAQYKSQIIMPLECSLDIAAASLSELERDGAKAVISTIVLMEVWDAMMATRDTVNDWLEKRREKARAEGIAEGLEEGRAEGRTAERAKWQAWYSKWEDARARNEPFDEPPPGADDE